MADEFEAAAARAEKSEQLRESQGKIAELKTDQTLAKLEGQAENPLALITPEYRSAMVGLTSNLIVIALDVIRLIEFRGAPIGDKIAAEGQKHVLLFSNVLATQACAWTEGKWPTWVGVLQVAVGIGSAVAHEMIEAEIKARSEAAKDVTPKLPQLVTSTGIEIPMPPPTPAH